MNRCVKCEAARAGTCHWITSFPAPEAPDITCPEPLSDTHEDTALRLHEKAGAPCKDQLTLDDFMDQIDAFIQGSILPATTDELVSTLISFEQFLTRLRRLPRALRPVFSDATLAAIEHALATIDLAFLRKMLDIQPLIQSIHPAYDRTRIFDNCGIPASVSARLLRKAQPYKEADAATGTPQEDTVARASLPEELTSPKAMAIWQKARAAGIVDDQYRFLGRRKTELAVFAACFSTELFKEVRYGPFEKWTPYRYYAKAYGDAQNRKGDTTSPMMSAILDLFGLKTLGPCR